ncbi:hypothetical protein BKA82DRAFT_166661, partial [Pisolithus tinctorius]
VFQLFQLTGLVMKKPCSGSGHPCSLTAHDVQYLLSCIDCTPNMYLSKLQYHLEQARGVYVSESTIECTLWRHGFTHKQVCLYTSWVTHCSLALGVEDCT